MLNCPGCGAEHESEDRYCPQCGGKLSSAPAFDPMRTQQSLSISDVHYKLGMVYFKKGDYLRAAQTWEKALEARPDDGDLKALIRDARSRHGASEAQP